MFFDDVGLTFFLLLLPLLSATTSAASAGVGSTFLPSPTTTVEPTMPHPAFDPQFTRHKLASCLLFSFRRLGVLMGTGVWVPRMPDAVTLEEAGAAVENQPDRVRC